MGTDIGEMMRRANAQRQQREMMRRAKEVELAQWSIEDLQEALTMCHDEDDRRLISSMIERKEGLNVMNPTPFTNFRRSDPSPRFY
jgi:hypothetical protein